jgi:hypothetical protein
MENMNKKYYDNIELLQKTNDMHQVLREAQKKLCYEKLTQENYEEYKKKDKEISDKIKINNTMQEILLNNFLYMQQELLNELLEIYKTKYINKRIGEKTKEKIQHDFDSYILGNYNIECYCYIRQNTTYNDEQETKISLHFKDLYYQYELRQEEIRYNNTTQEQYLYYYSKIDYTNIEEIEEKAKTLRNNYDRTMEKIKELKKEIEKAREENNEKNKCCLTSTYIDVKDC